MKSVRILSLLCILAIVAIALPSAVLAQEPTPGAGAAVTTTTTISGLAPAYINAAGQLESMGPEPTITQSGQEPKPTKKAGPIKVGFTPTAMNTHYQVVINGALTAIDELGGKNVIDMVVQAPTSQSGTAEQMNIVEGWIQQGFDAIAVCSANDKGMTPIYKRAAEKGIPIFIFNEPDPSNLNPYYVSSVGYDQEEAGRLIGLWLVQNFGDKPTNLAVIEGLPGTHNTIRLRGFHKAIDGNANIKIVTSQPGNWVRADAQAVMENMLTAHPEIQVVWGMYDEMSLGALAAIKARNLAGKIVIMGYDNTPDAYEAIKRGEMHSTVDTTPKEMGYNLIYAIKKYVMDGEMVPKVINSKIGVWDQSNINNFDTNNYKYVPKS